MLQDQTNQSYYSTVGIWIANQFGIQMVENSLFVKWFLVQTTIWLPNNHLISDHLNNELLVPFSNDCIGLTHFALGLI